MADTGVPNSLSKTYADPAQGYAAAANAVPQAAQIAEAQRRTGIDQQNADTSAANARTQEFSARASAGIAQQNTDLAKLTQAMQSRESDARVAKFKLDTALDAALFDVNKRKAEENLNSLIIGNEAAKGAHSDKIANDQVYAQFSRWKASLDPERTMLDPTVQDEFAGFFNATKGIEMKRLLQAEFEKAKGDSFQLSQTHLASNWPPEIGAKLLEGWGTLTPAQKAWRVQVGNNRKAELDRVAAVRTFNELVRPSAPDMVIDPDGYVMAGQDDGFGNPVYNVHAMDTDLIAAKAQFESERAIVSAARAHSDKLLSGKERAGQEELATLSKQLGVVQSNIRSLSTARDSKAADAMDMFIGSLLAEKAVAPELVAQATTTPKNDAERALRDAARTKLITEAASDWKKQERELLKQVQKQQTANPRAEFYKLTKDVSEATKLLAEARSLVSSGKAGASEEDVRAAEALLNNSKEALNSFVGEEHSQFYDGSYKVNPRGLPGSSAAAD